MNDVSSRLTDSEVAGDAAVDGVIGGLVAGTAMMLLLLLAGLLDGSPPLETLGYFDPSQSGMWLTGLLAHLAVSAIYGALFGLARRLIGRLWPPSTSVLWLLGAGYGLILLAFARGLLSSATASWLGQLSGWSLALSHLVYGLVLGLRKSSGS